MWPKIQKYETEKRENHNIERMTAVVDVPGMFLQQHTTEAKAIVHGESQGEGKFREHKGTSRATVNAVLEEWPAKGCTHKKTRLHTVYANVLVAYIVRFSLRETRSTHYS